MQHYLFPSAILLLSFAACPALGEVETCERTLVLVPAELELADLSPNTTATHSVWVVNTGPQPVYLRSAKGDCGCTAVDFQPTTLAPCSTMEVPLRIRSPRTAGETKSVTVTFDIEGAPPLKLPVRVAVAGVPLQPQQDIAAEPASLDLGTVVAGSTMTTSARLVNNGQSARTITAATSAGALLRVVDFKPFELAPGEAADVQLEVDVPASAGPATRDLTVLIEGERPLRVPLRLRSAHPAVEAAQQELARTLAPGLTCADFEVRGATVTAVAWDAQRTIPQGLVTCLLDTEGRIESVSFKPLHASPRAAS